MGMNVQSAARIDLACVWQRERASIGFCLTGEAIMLAMTVILMAVATQSPAGSKAICEVGRAALRDLPPVDTSMASDTYYAGAGASDDDLLAKCPKLQRFLPDGYRRADDEAQRRADIHAPSPDTPARAAVIYTIRVLKLSTDRHAATVQVTYVCTGLCGGAFEARYVRTSKGWQRQGEVRPLFLS